MIFKKTILAISCSLVLAACGGGGGGDSSGGAAAQPKNPTDGSVIQQPENDLANAKNLIQSLNNIIAYYDGFADIEERYKAPIQAVSDTAGDIKDAADVVVTLTRLAQEDAQGQTKNYTAQDLERLLEGERGTPSYILKNNTLQIAVSANSVKVAGTVTAKAFQSFNLSAVAQDGWPSRWYEDSKYHIYGDDIAISVNNFTFEEPITDQVASTLNAKIGAGSSLESKNLVSNKTAKFSFADASTLSVTYANAAKMDDRAEDEVPQNAQLKLSNVKFESEGLTAVLAEFSTQAKTARLTDGARTYNQLIPSEIVLKGNLALDKELLNLDAKLSLYNDFNKVFDVRTETPESFINAGLSIKLSGNLKGAGNIATPFFLSVNAKRAELSKGTADIEVAVDKSVLDIQLAAQQLNSEAAVSAVIKNKTGASVSIADIDNFTQADIMVNGKSQGKVTNNAGRYVASFTDKTLVYITP